jgi:ABC-type glycerol-3-phosphate transport system permease component
MTTVAEPVKSRRVTGESGTRHQINTSLKYIGLTLLTLLWLLPIFAAFATSFRTMDEIAINGFWSIP